MTGIATTYRTTRHRNLELWAAFFAILLISALYFGVAIAFREIPASSDFFGHIIGVIGFILMVLTETLYSWRKRSRRATWGRMSQWLNFHIFTGIVGPFMVLLHSAWRFQGLAGVTMLLTVIIVISGFIGRYIYTAVPRSADGAELEAQEIEQEITAIQEELQELAFLDPLAYQTLAPALAAASVSDSRRQLRKIRRKLDPRFRKDAIYLERLFGQQEKLHRQLNSLATARRMLSLWHTIHVPIGMALFTAAVIHIVAAFYYATLLK